MEPPTDRLSTRLAVAFLGTVVGGVVGLIVAVNLVIHLGPDQGYESDIGAVFEHSTMLGLVTLAVLVAGPVVGAVLAGQMRRQRVGAGRPG